MREIKFRGKRVDNGEWVYGYYIRNDEGEEGIKYIIQSTSGYKYVIPKTIKQYTELKDTKRSKEFPNGEKLFEGDIIKFEHEKIIGRGFGNLKKYFRNYEIVFVNSSSQYGYKLKNGKINFMITQGTLNLHKAEKIGNICDNPKLLEG